MIDDLTVGRYAPAPGCGLKAGPKVARLADLIEELVLHATDGVTQLDEEVVLLVAQGLLFGLEDTEVGPVRGLVDVAWFGGGS